MLGNLGVSYAHASLLDGHINIAVGSSQHEEVLLRVTRVLSEVRPRPGRDRVVETSAQAPRGLGGQPLRYLHLKEAGVVMRQGPRDPDVYRERFVLVAGEEEEAVGDLGTDTEEELRPQQLLQEQ